MIKGTGENLRIPSDCRRVHPSGGTDAETVVYPNKKVTMIQILQVSHLCLLITLNRSHPSQSAT